jgi:hypothetical protein
MPAKEDFLRYRTQTDPVADQVIEAIEKMDGYRVEDLLSHLVHNRDIDRTALPPVVDEYFSKNEVLPSYTNSRMLLTGQEVFQRHGTESTLLLFFLSLPAAYACWRGALVLYETGRLAERRDEVRYSRRMMETAQFVIDVMAPGAFDAGGTGIVAALKVRLIHASIRYFIRKRGGWDTTVYGEPINQQDMAGTLMSFSAMVLNGLKKMGIRLTPDEEEGYFHCWRVTGHLVGLDAALIPETYSQGVKLGFAILDDQKGPSEHGNILVQALVNFVNEKLPGKLLDNYLPIYLINHFVGENIGGVLTFQHKPTVWDRVIDFLIRTFSSVLRFFRVDKTSVVVGKMVVMKDNFQQLLITHFNEDKQVFLTIPPSLRDNWKLDSRGKARGVTQD